MSDSGKNIAKGVAAGFVGTLVLSALMIGKAFAGLAPQLNAISMLAGILGTGLAGGWLAHFIIGTIFWGGLFGWLAPHVPGGSSWLKGTIFSVGPWILMMILVMPLAGAGLFGLTLGVLAPVMTLVLHLIFGAVMGVTYGAMTTHAATGAYRESHRT
jgi:hypothetical protein